MISTKKRKVICLACIILLLSATVTFYRFKAEADGLVNINTATISELEELPQVGEKRSQYIVEYRSKNRIEEIDQLEEVKSIGPTTAELIADKIKLE